VQRGCETSYVGHTAKSPADTSCHHSDTFERSGRTNSLDAVPFIDTGHRMPCQNRASSPAEYLVFLAQDYALCHIVVLAAGAA